MSCCCFFNLNQNSRNNKNNDRIFTLIKSTNEWILMCSFLFVFIFGRENTFSRKKKQDFILLIIIFKFSFRNVFSRFNIFSICLSIWKQKKRKNKFLFSLQRKKQIGMKCFFCKKTKSNVSFIKKMLFDWFQLENLERFDFKVNLRRRTMEERMREW